MDGYGLGVEGDSCANKGMIYYHLHNLAFVHTKGQIFRSAPAVWGQDSVADSEPAAPIISPVFNLPYVNQSVDLQVLLIGDAER